MALLLLDRHSGTPVYRQIVDQIRRLAATGVLPPGEELPSTRALGAEHGVNPMTVSRAYAELEREGVLERRPGLPHRVRAEAAGEEGREAELERALAPAVRVARQLGLGPERACQVLRGLFEEGGNTENER